MRTATKTPSVVKIAGTPSRNSAAAAMPNAMANTELGGEQTTHCVRPPSCLVPQALTGRRSLGLLGHATDLCFAEIKHGGSNVCTQHLSCRNNGRRHLSLRPGHESILFGYDLGPTTDDDLEPN
jgi:hypothetical protein